VRFVNPYDTSRPIFMFHCTTHNIKNTRTQVWQSSDDGPKQFFDVNCLAIGKPFFIDAWLHDEDRADGNALRRTDLRQAAINLDKWSKMCAKWAKAGFSFKTLLEILEALYLELNTTRDEMYRVADHPTGQFSFLSTTAIFLKELLKKKDPNTATSH